MVVQQKIPDFVYKYLWMIMLKNLEFQQESLFLKKRLII